MSFGGLAVPSGGGGLSSPNPPPSSNASSASLPSVQPFPIPSPMRGFPFPTPAAAPPVSRPFPVPPPSFNPSPGFSYAGLPPSASALFPVSGGIAYPGAPANPLCASTFPAGFPFHKPPGAPSSLAPAQSSFPAPGGASGFPGAMLGGPQPRASSLANLTGGSVQSSPVPQASAAGRSAQSGGTNLQHLDPLVSGSVQPSSPMIGTGATEVLANLSESSSSGYPGSTTTRLGGHQESVPASDQLPSATTTAVPVTSVSKSSGVSAVISAPPRPAVLTVPLQGLGAAQPATPGLVPPANARPFTVHPMFASGALTGVVGSTPAGIASRFPFLRGNVFPLRPPIPTPGSLPLRPAGLLRPPGLDPSAKGQLLTEKPQTTVYVGKIAPSVDDEFLRSILELCGLVKSWKRAPSTGPKGFGFCEFETAEGVLRALRLLNKLSLDGQELVLKVNQTTQDYLERYIEKKKENEKLKETVDADVESAPGVEVLKPEKPPVDDGKNNEATSEEQNTEDKEKNFGIVNNEDKEVDEEVISKLASMLEDRARLKPLPPASPITSGLDVLGKSTEVPARSKDGESGMDGGKKAGSEGKMEEEVSENKASSEIDKPETSSSDRGRRDRERDRGRSHDRDVEHDGIRDRVRDKGRERDRDRERMREQKTEKEREAERFEQDRESERIWREKDREKRSRVAEKLYEEKERLWEEHEKDRERIQSREREKERLRERDRRRLIKDQEEESDEETWRKRRYRGDIYDDKRKRIRREREDDKEDCIKEEEEIAEAKRRRIEEMEAQLRRQQAEAERMRAAEVADAFMDLAEEAKRKGDMPLAMEKQHEHASNGDAAPSNGIKDMVVLPSEEDMKRSDIPAPKKLGFGLVGAGKRGAIAPSVFHQEDEDETPKERGLRQLVPIEYSADEMQVVSAVRPAIPGVPSNLAAAAEFAKSLSNLGKDEMEMDRERGKRSREKKDEDKLRDEQNQSKEEVYKLREREKAKQMIDTIPKTKEELFKYSINWAVYDQHELHERLRPWICKKIFDFLGEEEPTLVDYIVSNTQKHVAAEQMLDLLEKILDDEAEMFVLKMWRMLIFEIKKVEVGLSNKLRGL